MKEITSIEAHQITIDTCHEKQILAYKANFNVAGEICSFEFSYMNEKIDVETFHSQLEDCRGKVRQALEKQIGKEEFKEAKIFNEINHLISEI
ncbi:MAG: hypothetical protein GY928_01295 [Colwellia sp.]|nr:hypothetical protein [Colwellia sp.]